MVLCCCTSQQFHAVLKKVVWSPALVVAHAFFPTGSCEHVTYAAYATLSSKHAQCWYPSHPC